MESMAEGMVSIVWDCLLEANPGHNCSGPMLCMWRDYDRECSLLKTVNLLKFCSKV